MGEEMKYILSQKEYETLVKKYDERLSNHIEGHAKFLDAYSDYLCKRNIFHIFFNFYKGSLDFAIDNDMVSELNDYEIIETSRFFDFIDNGHYKEVHLSEEEYKELIGENNAD